MVGISHRACGDDNETKSSEWQSLTRRAQGVKCCTLEEEEEEEIV